MARAELPHKERHHHSNLGGLQAGGAPRPKSTRGKLRLGKAMPVGNFTS
jgi:hypothetical protein